MFVVTAERRNDEPNFSLISDPCFPKVPDADGKDKADADAEFGLIADVLEELRKAEALRVNFATNQERDE